MTLSVLDTNKSNFTTGRAGGLLLCHSVVLSQNELFSGAVRVNKHNDNKKTKRMMPLGVLNSRRFEIYDSFNVGYQQMKF